MIQAQSIKPIEKRIVDEVKNTEAIAMLHVDGLLEDIIPVSVLHVLLRKGRKFDEENYQRS